MKFFPAIICDDVRIEQNGKHLIIGVYASDLLVAQFPANLSIAMWVPCESTKLGSCNLEARGINQDDAVLFNVKAQIEFVGLGRSGLPLPAVPVQIQSAGTIRFQMRCDGGEWETVATVPVKPMGGAT